MLAIASDDVAWNRGIRMWSSKIFDVTFLTLWRRKHARKPLPRNGAVVSRGRGTIGAPWVIKICIIAAEVASVLALCEYILTTHTPILNHLLLWKAVCLICRSAKSAHAFSDRQCCFCKGWILIIILPCLLYLWVFVPIPTPPVYF